VLGCKMACATFHSENFIKSVASVTENPKHLRNIGSSSYIVSTVVAA